jgi:hypothetical protein
MTSLRFVNYIFGFTLLVVVTGFSINYIVDPYSVFGSRFFPEYGQLQERYLKIEYLKKNSNFNTFLIGSSTIGPVKTEIVDTYLLGAKSYNLTISQANQWDVDTYIEWLIKNIPSLTHVIVQIDWQTAYGSYRPNYALLDEVHPDISGRLKSDFLLDYLTLFNIEAIKAKISNNSGGIDLLKYDMAKGYWSRPLRDKKIEENCTNYVANEKGFSKGSNSPQKTESSIMSNNLASIARYKNLLDKKNVKLTILLTPHNHHLIDSINIKDYEYFVRNLVNITDVYNFMYYNKLTKNDCNYYEASHYRPVVGEIVVRSLAKHSNNQSEIYQYVTKTSINTHIQFLKTNFFSERGN